MGFFKNLGKSFKGLSKMISLKNVVKVATGNVSGLAKEAAGRVFEPHMKTQQETADIVNSQGVQMAQTQLQEQSNRVASKVINEISGNKFMQENTAFFSKLWFATMWEKYKNMILIGLAGAVAVWFFFFKKPARKTYRR